MADKKLKVADTTYCDDALKKWDESLPPKEELDKSLSALLSSMLEWENRIANLRKAYKDERIWSNYTNEIAERLRAAASSAYGFMKEYGKEGISVNIDPVNMGKMMQSVSDGLTAFWKDVDAAWFNKIDDLERVLADIKSVRSIFASVVRAADIIRDEYFKTEPNRRKPIIRDLRRIFSEIGSTDFTRPLQFKVTDGGKPIEEKDFLAVIDSFKTEANRTAKILKDFN